MFVRESAWNLPLRHEPPRGTERDPRQDHRAISVPLAPVNDSQPRSLAGTRMPSSAALNCGGETDSQADSAGSILVTRSTMKRQVTPLSIGAVARSTASHGPVRAINVQLACWHGHARRAIAPGLRIRRTMVCSDSSWVWPTDAHPAAPDQQRGGARHQ